MVGSRPRRWLGGLAATLALALCACNTGPAPRPTATTGFARSPTPDAASFTATSAPRATAGPTDTPAAYPPAATARATLTPGAYVPPPNTPTASLTPRESHTPRPSPTPTQSPTVTPFLSATPDPLFLSVEAVACQPAGGFARCTDPVLGLRFEQPAAWGPMTATLRLGADSGIAYEYDYGASPPIVSAGGRSADFAEGRGGILTDFSGSGRMGFNGASPAAWCAGLAASSCEVVQPNVVLAFRFPEAEALCLDGGPYFFREPLALIWVLLPDHPQINGFVFVAPFLSDEAGERVLDLRRDILGLGADLLHTRCQPAQQAEFDAEIAAYIADFDSGQVDPDTLELVAGLRHLAESIQPAP